MIKHAEPVQISTLLDSLISRASKMRDAVADAAVWATTLKDVKNKFMDQSVDRRFSDELLGPGNWPHLPDFPIKKGYKWRPINDAKKQRFG
eukprot:14015534-Heterocapsa_arctica.AAC.1